MLLILDQRHGTSDEALVDTRPMFEESSSFRRQSQQYSYLGTTDIRGTFTSPA